jgi:putative lipoic acid-binding regulatory protein
MESDSDVIKFPFYIPLKAIGKDNDHYVQFVVDVISEFVADLNQEGISIQPSQGGKYIAVTVPFTAQSRSQLDAIYQRLKQDPRTVFLL